jgi:hypothetical protein
MRFQLAALAMAVALAGAARAEELTVPLAVRDGGFEPVRIKTASGA